MNFGYIASVSASIAVFMVASVQDIREREVSDALWILLGGIGFALFALGVVTGGIPMPGMSYLVILPALFLFADMFIDWERAAGRYGGMLRYGVAAALFFIAFVAVASYLGEVYVAIISSLPLWILFVFILYKLDVIKGGADAKALVTLAVLFPLYPPTVAGPGQPLFATLTFPFFVSVLMMAAIFSIAVPLYLLITNIASGSTKIPHMLLGFRKEAEAVDLRREWLLEVPDGSGMPVRVKKLGSVDEESELERMRALGWRVVWITPKIPFIVPMTAGLLFVLFFGNPLLFL